MPLRPFFVALLLVLQVSTVSAQQIRAQNDPDAISDLRVATGDKDIAEAWLISPTTRYDHFVQGSSYEPGGIRVRLRDGKQLTLLLDEAHVFEDRQPRLADLDGDGRDEIVLVLTSLSKGASLAAYSVIAGKIVLKAKTPFIGQPYRWLNPAGIGDFDGDGHLEVALVAMPHLAKQLEVWRLIDGIFARVGNFEGYSNHRNGSPSTGMSVVADFNDDGIVDLALPDSSRRAIRFVSMVGMRAREIDRVSLPFAANGNFEFVDDGENGALKILMENGEIAEIRF